MSMLAGIDIGEDRVRGIVLDSKSRLVLRAEEVRIGGESRGIGFAGSLEEALGVLKKSLGLRSAVVAATADLDVIVTRTSLPFEDPERFRKVVGFHIEDRLPFDVTEWAVDYVVTGLSESGVELLVFGARRVEVEELLGVLVRTGIYPQVILPRAVALYHAATGGTGDSDESSCGAVWAGAKHLDIAVRKAGSLAFARSVLMGVNAPVEELSETILREVRVSLWTAGVSPGSGPIFVGIDGTANDSLPDRLREALASPVHVINPGFSEHAGPQGDAKAGSYALARGAALALQCGVKPDLARPVRSLSLTARATSLPLTVFLLTALVAGGMFLAFEARRASWAHRVLSDNTQSLHETWETLYPGEPMPPDPVLRVHSDLLAGSGHHQFKGLTPVDPLPALQRVIGALQVGGGLEIDGFRIANGEVVLTCTAENLAAADSAVAAIEAEVEATVTAENPESLGNGKHTFEIKVQWREGVTGESSE